MPDGHAALLSRLERQLTIVQDERYVTALGEAMRRELMARVPVATGNLASKLLRLGGPRRLVGSRFQVWIGDARGLGNANRAPRGTIKAFLKDFPQYRLRRKQGQFFSRSEAWWMLSHAGKAKLQELRQQGLYGGGYQGIGSGKAAYFYPQEGSQPEWGDSARRAGITPTHFVGEAVQVWTAVDLPRTLAQFYQDLARA